MPTTVESDGNGKKTGVTAILGTSAIPESEQHLEPAGSSPPRVPPAPAASTIPAMDPEPQMLRVQVPPAVPPRQRPPRPQYVNVEVPQGGPNGPLPRRSFAMAFKSNEGKVMVSRVDSDNREQLIPATWPASYLAACGLSEQGIMQFVLKHVEPDWGGGSYIVRGVDQNGVSVGDAMIEIAGPPKDGPRSPPPGAPPPGVNPRDWAEAMSLIRRDGNTTEKPKSMADALTEIQQLRTAEVVMGGRDSKVAALEKTIEELKAKLEQAAAPPVTVPATPVAAESDLDRLLKLNQLLGQRNTGPDPTVNALTEQVKALGTQIAALTAQKAEEERKVLQQEIKELRDKLDGKNNLGRLESLKQEVTELRDVADTLSPPSSGGSTFADFATKMAESWTPGAIGALIEQNAAAQERVQFAKARAALAVKRGLPPKRQEPEPPLRRHVPESQRDALMEATDTNDLKTQIEQLIFRLISINDANLTKHLQNVLESVAKEEKDKTTILIARLLSFIYGKTDEAKALVLRVTDSLYANREELLSKFSDGEEGEEDDESDDEEGDGEEEEEDGGEKAPKPAAEQTVDTEAKPAAAPAEAAAEPAPAEPSKPRRRGK